jgi:5'-3' exonuclease
MLSGGDYCHGFNGIGCVKAMEIIKQVGDAKENKDEDSESESEAEIKKEESDTESQEKEETYEEVCVTEKFNYLNFRALSDYSEFVSGSTQKQNGWPKIRRKRRLKSLKFELNCERLSRIRTKRREFKRYVLV